MVALILFCTAAQAETVPMKYCELACVYDMIKTLHNGESGLFSSASSSVSSLSPLTFAEQYCTKFIADEKECVVVIYGNGKTSNHHNIIHPFSSISSATYGFNKRPK